jgi:quercetin dioxygenase-like cupin family protein
MNITDLHSDKPISSAALFKSETGTTVAIQIQKGERFAEHITKVPALLVCISGHAVFENEKGEKHELKAGDYVQIEAMVKHWVDGIHMSQLMLIK